MNANIRNLIVEQFQQKLAEARVGNYKLDSNAAKSFDSYADGLVDEFKKKVEKASLMFIVPSVQNTALEIAKKQGMTAKTKVSGTQVFVEVDVRQVGTEDQLKDQMVAAGLPVESYSRKMSTVTYTIDVMPIVEEVVNKKNKQLFKR